MNNSSPTPSSFGENQNHFVNANANRARRDWWKKYSEEFGRRFCVQYSGMCTLTFLGIKANSGEIRTGVPYKIAAASDGSPSAALMQPPLVTTTHWTTSFR